MCSLFFIECRKISAKQFVNYTKVYHGTLLIICAAIPVKVIDNGDGTYLVAFVPEKLPGVYSIAVGLEDEHGHLDKSEHNQIKDFPILVQLGPGVCMYYCLQLKTSLWLADDATVPLVQAAEGLLVDLDSLGHKPEDGEGGYGFDIVPNPEKRDAPDLSEIGASLVAEAIDDELNGTNSLIIGVSNFFCSRASEDSRQAFRTQKESLICS